MKNDKIKKYLIPNIPYLFILWACLKMGTAYRLAAGADFAHKLMGLGLTIGPAFADFAPGLNPFDWLVGIVGAAGFRLLIYMKSKNAKKFRRDEEYGSARWGNEKDIRPFVDPQFSNNVILTGTEFLTMNTRPKIPANARNLNCCVIGSSGSGKTRFWLTPQLLQAHSSFVVVDPKGGVLSQVGCFLQKKKGYKVKVFNSIDFSKSMHAGQRVMPAPLPGQPDKKHDIGCPDKYIEKHYLLVFSDGERNISYMASAKAPAREKIAIQTARSHREMALKKVIRLPPCMILTPWIQN